MPCRAIFPNRPTQDSRYPSDALDQYQPSLSCLSARSDTLSPFQHLSCSPCQESLPSSSLVAPFQIHRPGSVCSIQTNEFHCATGCHCAKSFTYKESRPLCDPSRLVAFPSWTSFATASTTRFLSYRFSLSHLLLPCHFLAPFVSSPGFIRLIRFFLSESGSLPTCGNLPAWRQTGHTHTHTQTAQLSLIVIHTCWT